MSGEQNIESKAKATHLSSGAVETIKIALADYRRKLIEAQSLVELYDTKQAANLKGLEREKRLVDDLQALIQSNDTTDVIIVDRDHD